MVAKNDSATGVVPALALATDREHDAVGAGQLGELRARILTAPIGMEYEALLRCPVGEGHLEGVFDQFGAHVIGQRPAHHPAAGQVDDRCQIGPALPGGDVGDVADVAPVELVAGPKWRWMRSRACSAPGRRSWSLRQRFLHRPSSRPGA